MICLCLALGGCKLARGLVNEGNAVHTTATPHPQSNISLGVSPSHQNVASDRSLATATPHP